MTIDPNLGVIDPSIVSAISAEPSVSSVVMADLPCRKCAYNLRGLPLAGRCPECGSAVGLSTYGDLLRFSDPEWVLKLRKGVTLILYGILTIVVGIVVVVALGVSGFISTTGREYQVWISAASLIGNIMVLIGSWLLTEPDPSGLGESEYGTARKLIRITLLLGVANTVVDLAMKVIPPQPPAVTQLILLVAAILVISNVIGTIAQLEYLNKLALRIPEHSLAARAKFLKSALGISYGIVAVASIAILAMTATGGFNGVMPLMMVFGCSAGIAGLASLVFCVMYLFMLIRFRNHLGEEAFVSQSSWAANESLATARTN